MTEFREATAAGEIRRYYRDDERTIAWIEYALGQLQPATAPSQGIGSQRETLEALAVIHYEFCVMRFGEDNDIEITDEVYAHSRDLLHQLVALRGVSRTFADLWATGMPAVDDADQGNDEFCYPLDDSLMDSILGEIQPGNDALVAFGWLDEASR